MIDLLTKAVVEMPQRISSSPIKYEEFCEKFCASVDFSHLETHSSFMRFSENKTGYLSIHWFDLYHGDIPLHWHPFDTLIFGCHGVCKVLGSNDFILSENEIHLFNKNKIHGFTTHNSASFWGLSMRFIDESFAQQQETYWQES